MMFDASSPAPSALSRDADGTLTEQLAARFREQISGGGLAAGARLPSVRECARRHGVSPHTVVAAYDQLLALGIVEARRQRGFYVREGAAGASARHARGGADQVPTHPLPISATSLIRGMFQPPGARPMPGFGTLPAEWLDSPLLAGALRKVTSGAQLGELSLRYGDPAGDARLREALALKLLDFGIAAQASQIVTTVGATHALDVVTRSLTRAGDSVLVDEPGWSVEYARLAALGLRTLPVPRGEDGPDLAVMQQLIDAQKPAQRPRLYVTVSVLNNPTGASISLQAAHRVLQLAQVNDLHIVEDDTYAHLAAPHLPRIAALDALERTIYLSGFSKILVPNWRVGFIAAPRALVDRFIDTKLLTTLTTPAITEQAVAYCLEQGLLRRHTERVTARLAAARARTVRLAETHGCRFVTPPRGLFGWLEVGVDTERLAQAMLSEWLIAPGALFHATPRPSTLMRINFASSQDLRFWRALDRTRAELLAGASAAPITRSGRFRQTPSGAKIAG
jgi:DNA-binding transcriptional MocR family regulator